MIDTYIIIFKRVIYQSMNLEQIEPAQLIEVANKLKPKLSSGHGAISTKLLKLSIDNDSILLPINSHNQQIL